MVVKEVKVKSNPATMEIKTIGNGTGRTGKKEALKIIFKKQEYIERGRGLRGEGRRMADTGQNKIELSPLITSIFRLTV